MTACPGTAWLRTEFPDGTVVDAHPNHEPEDLARAKSLGYPSVQEMTMDHDLFHQLLAWALLGQSSRVVTGTDDPEFAEAEEAAVLALQRYLQAARRAGLRPHRNVCAAHRLTVPSTKV